MDPYITQIILAAISVINLLYVVVYKEGRTFQTEVEGTTTVKNTLLTFVPPNKVKPNSEVTCTDDGQVACKKIKVGDVDIGFEDPSANGILFMDDSKISVSKDISCDSEGNVTCKKIKVGNLKFKLEGDKGGLLTYDKATETISVAEDAPLNVTTENTEIKNDHIALFAANSNSTIKPSKLKIDPSLGNEVGRFVLTLENDVIKRSEIKNFLKFSDDVLPAENLAGAVVVHGAEKNELSYSRDLRFDLEKMKTAAVGDFLALDAEKLIVPKKIASENFVKMKNNVVWDADRLLVSTANANICDLSSVKLNLAAPTDNEEHIIVNRNNVLTAVPNTTARVANPKNLSDLSKRLAVFDADSANTIVPSSVILDFDSNAQSNVGKILTLASGNRLQLIEPKSKNVVLTNPPAPGGPQVLAMYQPNSGAVVPTDIKITKDDLPEDETAILTIKNNEIQYRPLPASIEIEYDRQSLDANKHYIPVITRSNKIKASSMYYENNKVLVIPSGEIQIGGNKIKIDDRTPLENGMYLVYDNNAFVPKKPTFQSLQFATPIDQVTKPSHLVLEGNKWHFREIKPPSTTTYSSLFGTKMELTTDAKPIPGMSFTPEQNHKTCVIFAECLAVFISSGTEEPAVCFYIQRGNEPVVRKYYGKIQSKFPITNYVSIFETIDTSSKKDPIQIYANVVDNIASGDKMIVNPEDTDNLSRLNFEMKKMFACRMFVRALD